MTPPAEDDLVLRQATDDDEPQVLHLLRDTMGWDDGGHDEAFFRWKHGDNPFGRSPAWVAVAGGEIVGYRTFLRWAFRDDEDRVLKAVRAVDTATHPDHRGRGIFRRLTLAAVAELTVSGVRFVFNTPNDQSRPGYLGMGWTVSRRLSAGVRPAGPTALIDMARARTAASLWSEPTDVGLAAAEACSDVAFCEALLRHAPTEGVRTDRSAAYLAWRTAFGPLHYRVLLRNPEDPALGGIVFRLRRRGNALEAAVVEQFVPDAVTGARLVGQMLKLTGADYAMGLRGHGSALLPIPGQGPLLTTRTLAGPPPRARDWDLTLGDVELF